MCDDFADLRCLTPIVCSRSYREKGNKKPTCYRSVGSIAGTYSFLSHESVVGLGHVEMHARRSVPDSWVIRPACFYPG